MVRAIIVVKIGKQTPKKFSTGKGKQKGKYKNFWKSATIVVKLAIKQLTVGIYKITKTGGLLGIIPHVINDFQLRMTMAAVLSYF